MATAFETGVMKMRPKSLYDVAELEPFRNLRSAAHIRILIKMTMHKSMCGAAIERNSILTCWTFFAVTVSLTLSAFDSWIAKICWLLILLRQG